MKKHYSTNLFYKYIIVYPGKTYTQVTENTFYSRLYSNTNFKSKRYPDREEIQCKDGSLFIRYFAYLDVEDYVIIEPFKDPEEVKPVIPKTKTNIEDTIFWHNIKNSIGKKYS